MIFPSSHQAPTMSSARKISPRPQIRGIRETASAKSGSHLPTVTKARRNAERIGGTERCRGRCRVQWSEKHVKEGLVLVQESQLARVVKTGPITEHYEIDPKPFASGQWTKVVRCRSRSTGIVYAAKYSSRIRFNADCSAELRHEIALLSLCSQSPRVVRLHDVYETPKEIILVMEFAPGGDLQTLIDGDLVPLEGDVVHFVRQLVEGLAYLHERNIAHLDIKPQNLVMMGAFPECDVKLCDFEISRVILDGTEIREILGTPDYVAPEILHYEPITLAADMWSLGVTTYVLLTGFSPFGGDTDQETFQNISRGELDFPEELFEDVSAQAKDFVARLLVPDPRARMSAKQCLRHEWLRGAPTQASPHLRRYLSKSREVLLERVVSRENLRRAALMSQAKSHANLTEAKDNGQGLGGNLSQSEMCLSYGLTGSQMSLPGSEEGMSPAHSQISLESSQNTFALSQSCLLNKEQTQGLLSQAQSKSHLNLTHGVNRSLLSMMRNSSETQSQVCLKNLTKNIPRHVLNPLFSRSRDKLYGLKSLSKSQGVLDIYRSLECLKSKKNQRAKTEDLLPIFKHLDAEIAASNVSLGYVDWDLNSSITKNCVDTFKSHNFDRYDQEEFLASKPTDEKHPSRLEVRKLEDLETAEIYLEANRDEKNLELTNKTAMPVVTLQFDNSNESNDSCRPSLSAPRSPSYDSEGNLDSLQSVESVESDTLTEDSDETPTNGSTKLSMKHSCQRQNSDLSSHSNNSGNSEDKDEHSESENDEPKYTVAQLVSAFNKHQEVASKTSLEAIMTEKRINEVTFPTGPKALRLFIPDINITESTIVRRKTSYKPRKNWEELRKMNERNEGLMQRDFDNDSGNEDEDKQADDATESTNGSCGLKTTSNEDNSEPRTDGDSANRPSTEATKCRLAGPSSSEENEPTLDKSPQEPNDDPDVESKQERTSLADLATMKIDEKYKQCVDGVASAHSEAPRLGTNEMPTTEGLEIRDRTPKKDYTPKERMANYIFSEVLAPKKESSSRTTRLEQSKTTARRSAKEVGRAAPSSGESNVNLKDILQGEDSAPCGPKENLEKLRKRTCIAKVILNDNLIVQDDAKDNANDSSSINRARSEPPSSAVRSNDKMQLDIPPSFVRSTSLSSDGSCLTPSSIQSDIGMSWEDVRSAKEDSKSRKLGPTWDTTSLESHKSQGMITETNKQGSTISLEERRTWGRVCTGSYTRAMEKFSGKSQESAKRTTNLHINTHQTQKTRRKSSPAMPQFVNP